MELKDVILSTLAEMENEEQNPPVQTPQDHTQEPVQVQQPQTQEPSKQESATHHNPAENELLFLNSIRERLLVLFEGFQAPNNANLEAKIDMTLNFLEYTLATIDERIEQINKDRML